MSRRRSLAFIPVAVSALLGGLGVISVSAAPPTATGASAVVHWNQVALETLRTFPGPAGGAPPAFQINMGMVQGAVYDAVNAIGPKEYRPYRLEDRTGAKASVNAAVATAAHDVLANLISTSPGVTNVAGRLTTLTSQYDASLGAITNSAFKMQGITIGHAAAKAMLDSRIGDGRFTASTWTLNPAAGHWSPIGGAAGEDPTQWAANTRPFLLESGSQFRSVPPPALDSPEWATEFNEVKALGRATGSTRNDVTDAQTYKARWWQSAPILSWNEVARQLIARHGLDAADSARLLALQNLSAADAAINCWNDKYHFDFWRPWNAIPRALEDGNDATHPDSEWTALLTAPYPEWVSGHNCLDGAHVEVMREFFGDATGGFQITTTNTTHGGDVVRTFPNFTNALAEIIEARIWAGLHYRSGDVAGQLLGRNVANYAMANYFQPVGH